ncbi:GNAT family N-acetyltransferase [Pseudolysinimonas kribbensis]|uniref:N-acetyltransferase GCN5 n=1 Tax=Pseudolysinimonas kribbensis TaxID=433641 RepID=A0ABQ6K105_9MICO|nr:GNAT family N-acetyltransferase [Pseudolysinimonas kribbensis]GMA93466.1 N-acetyltransferase GCN5 [Pseudolysinimonas kribbensis]
MTDEIRVVPANEASVADVDAIFGSRGWPARCSCQWFKVRAKDWDDAAHADEYRDRLHEQTSCGDSSALTTSGLVAYLGDEAVGWCAVEPRTAYVRIAASRMPWAGRDEDKADEGVWAVTCFVTRTGYRRRGVMSALAAATVDYARARGARAIEGYPLEDEPGRTYSWGELYVGSRGVFAAAGFTEASHSTPRRVVMRREL